MNYRCEYCGSYLDPGEHCDCKEEEKDDPEDTDQQEKTIGR